MVNISTRLVNYAIKILQDGCGELIATVDSGGLAVSTASVLAGLNADKQEQALVAGPKFAAFRARQLRAKTRPAGRPSSGGPFRVARNAENADEAFICIDELHLPAAIAALQARGFRRIGG